MAPWSHPFVLDVRQFRQRPGRFTYSVGHPKTPKRYSPHTYATFEEARLAGQAELKALIAAWESARPLVEAALPASASSTRKPTTASDDAGRSWKPYWTH